MLRHVTVLNNLRHLYFLKCVSYLIGGFTLQYRVIPLWVVVVDLLLPLPIIYGSLPPLGAHLSNPLDPVFRLSTAPVSGETPVHRLVASDRKVQALEKDIAATRQAIGSLCDRGLTPPQSLMDSLLSLSRELDDAKRTSSELRGAIRPPSSQPGVSSHHQRFATVQPGPSQPEGDPAFAGPSFSGRQPYDFPPSGSFGRSFRQGSDPPPTRGVG